MLPTIDLLEKGQEIKIQICNSRMQVIGNVKEADSKSYDINTGRLNELSFIIPLYIDNLETGLQKNPDADLLVNRCVLKVKYGKLEEYFIIDNYDDSDDSQFRNIHAFSLGNQLNDKLIKNYASQTFVTTTDPTTGQTSSTLMDAPIDITTAITDALQNNSSWSVGYIDPAFNGMFRFFEFDSQTGLEYIYQIGTAFNAIITWDTKNKKINAYHPDFYGSDKGFKITDDKYISNLVKKTSDDEFCTRLYLYGKDGITINSVSPLGQSYIEDFSYFMNNGMMSKELIDSLISYNDYILSRQGEFPSLLTQLNTYQSEISTLKIDLSTLKNKQLIVQDQLDTISATNGKTTILYSFDTVNNINRTSFSDGLKRVFFFTVNTNENPTVFHNGTNIVKSANGVYIVKVDSNINSELRLNNFTNPIQVEGYFVKVSATDFELSFSDLEDKFSIDKFNYLVSSKQTEINNKQSQIDSVMTSITQLKNDLSIENFLSVDELNELDQFIIEKEYTDDNILDAEELLEVGKKQLKERNIPQVLYDASLVNFLSCLEEKRNWDKISIFDIVRIQSKKLDVDIKARIINIKIDTDTITLTIANSKNVKDEPDKFIQLLYGTVNGTKALQRKEGTWDDAATVKTQFNEYLQNAIDATKQKIVAGINENIQINERGIKVTSPDDINTFLIINHGVIALTKDGGNTWRNALTTDGVTAETVIGKLLLGSKLTLANEQGTFVVDGGNVTIDGGSTKAKIIINPTDGVKIKTSPDDGTTWIDTFFVDINGIIHARGMIISDHYGNSVMIDSARKVIDFSQFTTIVGKLNAENITVGSNTTFEQGYDPIEMTFGGRNYLLNSNFDRNLYFWTNTGAVIDTIPSLGRCIKIDGELNTTKYIKQTISSDIFMEFSKADSFYIGANTKLINYVAGTTNPLVSLRVEISYSGTSLTTIIDQTIPASEWQRLSWQITKPSDILFDIAKIDFYVYGSDFTGSLWVDEIMFEIGTKPTSWQPAPEDVNDTLYEQILTNYKRQLETAKSEIDAKYAQIPQPTTQLKVATWNIHGGKDQNGSYVDLSKAPRTLLANNGFDLLGMQEVLAYYSKSISKYPLAALLTGVFYQSRFSKAINMSDQSTAEFGNALMSKRSINNLTVYNLPSGGYEQRILMQSDFILNGKKVYVFVTHLTWDNDSVRLSQMQYLKNKFDSLNGAPFICFGDFNVRSSNEFDIFSPTYQFANGHNGTYFDTYNLADWSTRRLDNIICSNDFIIAAKGVVPTSLSDHSIFFTILNVPNELQAKKNVFDTKYNDLISAINTALADGTATEAEKLDVDAKIELFKTAISDLGVTYDLSVQEVYNADYVQNTGSINEIIESGIRGDMRLDAPLPTFITMDNNGITATTEDTERYARMDYRGFFVKKGAFSLERPDGYLLINDGLANFDFSIDSSEPPFMDGGVTQSGLFFRGTNFNWGSCNYYSYKQTGRYLKLMLSVKCDAGTTGWVRILNGNTELWKYTTTQTSFFGEQVTATIDLGAPTGLANDFYLQLATGDSTQTKAAYVRVLRKWLEG